MTKGFIQSQDGFNDCVIVGPDEADFRFVAKTTDNKEISQLPLIGFFGASGGKTAFLYRWQGELRIRIDDGLPIPVTDELSVTWAREGNEVTFTLMQSGQTIFELHYLQSEDLANINSDPTPFIEPEDFDIFLFIRNVLSDAARKDRMFR